MMYFFFQGMTQANTVKEIRVLLSGVEPKTRITSSDALPLSYRRRVGAKAIKQAGSLCLSGVCVLIIIIVVATCPPVVMIGNMF